MIVARNFDEFHVEMSEFFSAHEVPLLLSARDYFRQLSTRITGFEWDWTQNGKAQFHVPMVEMLLGRIQETAFAEENSIDTDSTVAFSSTTTVLFALMHIAMGMFMIKIEAEKEKNLMTDL